MEQLYVVYAQDPLYKWKMIRITSPMNKSDVELITDKLVNYVVKEV